MRAVFKYPGSKWSIAEWIVAHFPVGYEKMVYLEPFAGSGAVFFTKNPGVNETINDLDGDVVNLFRVLREQPDELVRALDYTPYSREEYDLSFEPTDIPLEKARRFMIRTTQGIGSKLRTKSGWQAPIQDKVGGNTCKWNGLSGTIYEAASRLKGSTTNLVHIEHTDALRLMKRYNRPEVLMYIDPPYLMDTRKSGRQYVHEMTDEQHLELLETIVKSRAKIVVSGYRNALYDEWLKSWKTDTTESRITTNEVVSETVWMNYTPPFEQIRMEVADD